LFLRGQSSQPSRVEFNTICANRNDYRLRRGSPCIDAGRVAFPEGLVHDIAGDPRCADGNCDGVALPDIGAFETQPLCLGISVLRGLSSVRLSWNSLPGEIYTVLATDSLEDGAWLDAGRISSQGDETRWSESLTAGRLRLYRILTHE
jgi:hypothetical protein